MKSGRGKRQAKPIAISTKDDSDTVRVTIQRLQ